MEGTSAYAALNAGHPNGTGMSMLEGMEGLFAHAAPYVGYVYPNETDFPWTVLIVVYPYLTGLVAGAFTVSSMYHVFGMERFKPAAGLALLTALCFLIFVPAALLLHLGHPERAFNSMITPHWTSAFVMFGYMAAFYVILLMLECWFVFRPHVVQQAQRTTGLLGLFYRVLSLGSYDLSPKAMRHDRKWIFALAVIGIPGAHGLHGYVGFVFGSLKSREWWSSDLMPPIFLFSAIISGTALLIVLYVLSCRLRRVPIDLACVKGLGYTLWGFVMFTLVLEGVEFGALVYRGREGIEVIMEFVTGRLIVPFFILQFGIGSMIPIVLLSYMIWKGTTGKALIAGVTTSALLVLLAVLMMRWNVVIGGQEIAKTGKGLLTYVPPLFGREGMLAAGSVAVAPLFLLWVMTRLFPPWQLNGAHAAAPQSGVR
jgi:Ni/Fe-hydrogenase subunit HybB-like protein